MTLPSAAGVSRTLVLTVLQLHLPLGQAGRGLELAVVPGEGGHEAGVVGGAHGPLLLALGQVGPGQQQHVGQSPAHQHLGLGGTRSHSHTMSWVGREVKAQLLCTSLMCGRVWVRSAELLGH